MLFYTHHYLPQFRISIRIPLSKATGLRATGPGWQTRVSDFVFKEFLTHFLVFQFKYGMRIPCKTHGTSFLENFSCVVVGYCIVLDFPGVEGKKKTLKLCSLKSISETDKTRQARHMFMISSYLPILYYSISGVMPQKKT